MNVSESNVSSSWQINRRYRSFISACGEGGMKWKFVKERNNKQLDCDCEDENHSFLVENFREILPKCVNCEKMINRCKLESGNFCIDMTNAKNKHYKVGPNGVCVV